MGNRRSLRLLNIGRDVLILALDDNFVILFNNGHSETRGALESGGPFFGHEVFIGINAVVLPVLVIERIHCFGDSIFDEKLDVRGCAYS
mgnify:CR=1 FL=1